MFALLISKYVRKMMLYLAKNCKLKMFPEQIQWEFVSAVPFSGTAGGGKRSDGIAPDHENTD